MIAGVATGTDGADGALHPVGDAGEVVAALGGAVSARVMSHCVDVSPVVTWGVVARGVGTGAAVLTSLNATPSPPMATRAPAPTPADSTLICFSFMVHHLQPAGRTLEQLIVLGWRPSMGRITEAAQPKTLLTLVLRRQPSPSRRG